MYWEVLATASCKSCEIPMLLNPLLISELLFKYNSSRFNYATDNRKHRLPLQIISRRKYHEEFSFKDAVYISKTYLFHRPQDQNEKIITNCYNWEK